MTAEIYREILREYDRERSTAEMGAQTRLETIYAELPRVRVIDDTMKRLGATLVRGVLSGQDNMNEYRELCEELKSERDDILVAAHYPYDFCEVKYHCPLCEDRGFVNFNERCDCFRQRIVNKLYDVSTLGRSLEKENFGTFDLSLFSGKEDSRMGVSPLVNMKLVLSHCKEFVANFGNAPEDLLFYGNAGLGKTFMCNCIAKSLLDAQKSVLYATAPNLFDRLAKERFAEKTYDTWKTAAAYEFVFHADLLIIDDLGTEVVSVVTQSDLLNIINTRSLHEKATIISTNLDMDKLQTTYTERVTSRLKRYTRFRFFGDDIREKKR